MIAVQSQLQRRGTGNAKALDTNNESFCYSVSSGTWMFLSAAVCGGEEEKNQFMSLERRQSQLTDSLSPSRSPVSPLPQHSVPQTLS